MLKTLQVRNFAIIDELTIDFRPGLNVITGETGAGKSIIFAALSVLLGGRFSSEMLRSGAEQCTVEALFDLSGLPQVRRSLAVGLLEGGGSAAWVGEEIPEEILLTRTLAAGKGRASVNGMLATVGMLKEIGERLVNFHGQHQHQRLLEVRQHRCVLDASCGLTTRARDFAARYAAYEELLREWRRLRDAERQRLQRRDLLGFQIAEIEAAAIDVAEIETLTQERRVLQHAAQLTAESYGLVVDLFEAEDSILPRLGSVARRLGRLVELDGRLAARRDELEAARLQLEEVARELQGYAAHLEQDPARLAEVEERIELLRGLQRKYGGSLGEVLAYLAASKAELDQLHHAEERLAELAGEAERRRAELVEEALDLARARRQGAARLGAAMEAELRDLRMQGARFLICFHPAPESAAAAGDAQAPEGATWVRLNEVPYRLTEHGIDDVEFYFAPNPGEEAKPLARIASGGELARLMLAVKRLIAAVDEIPCLIFDEVDAGIGGETAVVVGEKLKEVTARHQVLCITHLPQIAALADAHYCITKEVRRNRTRITIRELTGEERVEEIARLAGGASLTDATRTYARELLRRRGEHDALL
ncbi:MAG: DNA repair protein RecN [Candidatus Tectomicrobia bacterium]|nr:DNA repair protein RecN [Candidatus Tectomicrobia bacterium]